MFLRPTLTLPASLAIFLTCATAQAHLVADLRTGSNSSMPSSGAIAILGESAVFTASTDTGTWLYTSDGTAAGTTAIVQLTAAPSFGYATEMVAAGGRAFFPWSGGGTGSELWATDGTAAGTGLVKDIRPGTFGSNPRDLGAIDGILYFAAAEAGGNYELWRSDGTTAGTWLVKEIHTTAGSGSNPAGFTKLGSTGRFLFAATDATSGRELWSSDGTATGTVLVKDIVPGAGGVLSSNPLYLVGFGDDVVFICLGNLWRSDGTAGGTLAVTSGVFNATGPRQLAVQNGKVWFQATDAAGAAGGELWSSDGTAAGTAMVANIAPGANGSFPFVLTPLGSRWVFFAATTTIGEELWHSDGTTTALFQDLAAGSTSGRPQANGYPGTHLLNSRFAVTPSGKMFFFATDGVSGFEPWVYDTGAIASGTTYGSGCGALSLTATTPYLGATVTLTTSGIPAAALLSANALSFTKYVPPLDLTAFGMPGCFQHCGLDAVVFLFGSPVASRTLAIPSDPSWLGAEIHSQSFALVPGINPMGAISSNGATLALGDL
jgi:ELWxxDGT repeat protein